MEPENEPIYKGESIFQTSTFRFRMFVFSVNFQETCGTKATWFTFVIGSKFVCATCQGLQAFSPCGYVICIVTFSTRSTNIGPQEEAFGSEIFVCQIGYIDFKKKKFHHQVLTFYHIDRSVRNPYDFSL